MKEKKNGDHLADEKDLKMEEDVNIKEDSENEKSDIKNTEKEENRPKEDEKDIGNREEEGAKAAAKAAKILEESLSEEISSEENSDPKAAKIAELEDRLKRNMAEFENFRKRNEKEKNSMFDMGIRHIAEKILPVIDNFERGFANVPDDVEAKAFAAGMEMIYKQLLKTLGDAGIVEIDAAGKKFNPDFHNAVMHVEDENEDENTIVEVLQKGYMYKDTVLRYSMVKVAN